MYDPSEGRWLEEDPTTFAAGDPNWYRFVMNGPTNATDPSGLAEAPAKPTIPSKPLPIDWSKGKVTEKKAILFRDTGVGKGKGYEIEIGKDAKGKPIMITYFEPAAGTQEEFGYDCHGLTFFGRKYSPYGESVPAILEKFYKEIPKKDVKNGDIMVLYGKNPEKKGTYIVIHSATFIDVRRTPRGEIDPQATRVQTKNGQKPEKPMTIDELFGIPWYTAADEIKYYTRK